MSIPLDPTRLYHGVYPGGSTGAEDDITPELVTEYERAVGRTVAWIYFSHNWYQGRTFPLATARWIRDRGCIPFIRLMLRSDDDNPRPEPEYTLEAIANGDFDGDLRAWGRAAREFATPLIVEWGTEMNGEWFAWNGTHNGGALGPARFQEAYRHIVRTVRGTPAAQNLTWVFHVNGMDVPDPDDPATAWNRMENYYPSGEFVDWLGISVYGAQVPKADEPCLPFGPRMRDMHDRLRALAPGKPIFLLEFGATKGHPNAGSNNQCKAHKWADAALDELLVRNSYPEVRGFSWWNERWENGNGVPDTDMRVQANSSLRNVFRRRLIGNQKVIDRPLS